MYKNENYIASFNGDLEAADRDLQQLKDLWKMGGNVGNLPIATLLDLAWRHQKKEKPASFSETLKIKSKIGRPKGAKNKPKPELVVTNG